MTRHSLPAFLVAIGLATLATGCQEPPTPRSDVATEHHEPPADEGRDMWPENGETALDWLLAGNERFVAGRPRHSHESIRRRRSLSGHQHPFAVVLACADSRVSPELILDHGLGDLFVIRVAGNVVAEDEAGSMEYAVRHLHTPLVMVLGHESCGAVTAALGSVEDEPDELVALMGRIRPALRGIDRARPAHEQIAAGVEANVRRAVARIHEIIERERPAEAELPLVVGAVYDLESGRVRVLE